MKKIFDFKSVLTKVALIMAIIILFEFVMSRPVKAETASFGGTLLEPIVSFMAFLGDGVISIMQSALLGVENSYIYVDLSKDNFFSFANIGRLFVEGVFGYAAGAIAFGAATVLTGGVWVVVAVAGAALVGAVGGKLLYDHTSFPELLSAMFGDSFVYASISITPENILNNKLSFFNVDFFNTQSKSGTTSDGSEKIQSAVESIRNVVSQVYVTVRDITLILIIIAMVILVIKMLMENRPMEKKRITDLLVNCVKGLAIIIMMHYIMYILVTINNSIAKSINNMTEYSNESDAASGADGEEGVYVGQAIEITEKGDNKKIYEAFKDRAGLVEGGGEVPEDALPNVNCTQDGNEYKTKILASNFIEIARYHMQKVYDVDSNDEDNKSTSLDRISWGIVYILLVAITVVYVWLYAKRVIYIAVLTMLAPVIGVMYPLNRSEGGRAQTLNYWFREYVASLTMQPFQCLLYSVLIGGAMQMALNNPIYAIVALISMVTLEKFIKSLIGMPESNIGGLGKALGETTKGLNNMTKAANKIVGTAAKAGAVGAIAGAGLINKGIDAAEDAKDSFMQGYNEEAGKIRTKDDAGKLDEGKDKKEKLNDPLQAYDPLQADIDAYTDKEANLLKDGDKKPESGVTEENFDPEAMGIPPEMADEIREINGWGKTQDAGLDLYEGDEKNKEGELDEEATLGNYLAEGFGQNDKGEFFNPYTDEYDPNYNPLNDAAFRVDKDGNPLPLEEGKDKAKASDSENLFENKLDEEATLQNYQDAGFTKNIDGEYFNPYTDEFDASYNPLNDPAFRVEKQNAENENTSSKGKAMASDNSANEKFLGGNGTMDAYSTPDGNIRLNRTNGVSTSSNAIQFDAKKTKHEGRAQASNNTVNFPGNGTPDGKDPMAMAMAANSGITHTTVGVGEAKPGKSSNTIEFSSSTMSTGGASTSNARGSSSSLGSVAGATSMPDGSNRVERTNKAQPSNSSVNISEKANSSSSNSSGTEISYIGNNSKVSNSTVEAISSSFERSTSSNGNSDRKVEVQASSEPEITYTTNESTKVEHSSPEITYSGDSSSSTSDFVASTFGSISSSNSETNVTRSTSSESETSRPQTNSRRINTSNAIRDNSSNSERTVEVQRNRDVEVTYTSNEPSRTENYDSGTTVTYTDNGGSEEISYGGTPTVEITEGMQKNFIETAKNAGIEIPETKESSKIQDTITSGAEKIANVFNTVADVSNTATNITEKVTNTMEKTLSGDVVGAATYVVDSVSSGVNSIGGRKTSGRTSNTTSSNNEVHVSEKRENPQYTETVEYVQREVQNMNKEKINVVINQCTRYKIKDKTNIGFVAEMHNINNRENPELTKMAAILIDAKRKGASLEDVKDMLEHSDKINNRERELLAKFYEKARQ